MTRMDAIIILENIEIFKAFAEGKPLEFHLVRHDGVSLEWRGADENKLTISSLGAGLYRIKDLSRCRCCGRKRDRCPECGKPLQTLSSHKNHTGTYKRDYRKKVR